MINTTALYTHSATRIIYIVFYVRRTGLGLLGVEALKRSMHNQFLDKLWIDGILGYTSDNTSCLCYYYA